MSYVIRKKESIVNVNACIGQSNWVPDLLEEHGSNGPWQPSPEYKPQQDTHFLTTEVLLTFGSAVH